jgi:hypothetical protein
MKKYLNMRVTALALAIIMAVSVSAISVSAASPNVGVNPDPDELLWYADEDFDTYWPSTTGGTKLTAYGYDTIQEIVYTEGEAPAVDTIDLVLHPQYYHDEYIDWENPSSAIGSFEILSLNVWNNADSVWEPVIDASVPAAYVLKNDDDKAYLKFQVTAVYIDLVDPDVRPVRITWDPAYLQIPNGVIPQPTV